MSNKAKIVWLRILHLFICIIIATVGILTICRFTYVPQYYDMEGYRGSYDPLDGITPLFFLFCCFFGLIIIHAIGMKLTIPFVIMSFVASFIGLLESDTCFFYSMLAMIPLFWLVSWMFERWINKLRN